MIIGYRFKELGHETKCKCIDGPDENGVINVHCLNSAHSCEECGDYIGRWMTCGCVETWCKECWEKRK